MAFDLERFLPYRLYQAAEFTSRAFHAVYKERYGLSRTEWRVLFNIGQYGPISGVEIARRSGLEKPKISRAVLHLEDRGWIERLYSRENRRTHDLKLTKEGESAIAELSQLASQFDDIATMNLGAKSLNDLLETLRRIEDIEYPDISTHLSKRS